MRELNMLIATSLFAAAAIPLPLSAATATSETKQVTFDKCSYKKSVLDTCVADDGTEIHFGKGPHTESVAVEKSLK